MKCFIYIFSLFFLLSCSSSNYNEDEFNIEWKKAEKEYRNALEKNWSLSKSHGILLKPGDMKITRSMTCDVCIVPDYLDGKVGFAFELFNYSDTIILCRRVREDSFFDSYALNAKYSIVQKEDVRIIKEDSIKTYGKYAYSNIYTDNRVFRNVFVSPCAYDLLFDSKSDDVLLLCYFYSELSNGQKMVLYRASNYAEILLTKQASQVRTYFDILPLGPDDTWEKIRSDEEQRKWEAEQQMKQIVGW